MPPTDEQATQKLAQQPAASTIVTPPTPTSPTPVNQPPAPSPEQPKAEAAKPENVIVGEAVVTKGPTSVFDVIPAGRPQRGPRLFGVDPSTPEGKKKVADALGEYVKIEELPPGGRFNFRFSCRECGWQTFQVGSGPVGDNPGGADIVKNHAQRHLYQP